MKGKKEMLNWSTLFSGRCRDWMTLQNLGDYHKRLGITGVILTKCRMVMPRGAAQFARYRDKAASGHCGRRRN
ncbi:MAG: hypothetical protein U0Q18_23565 [Bryobacteraceae bacterium]